MASYLVRETFFRPEEAVGRELSSIPAAVHNSLTLLLNRADSGSLFVPIRSMQYLAVADREEVVFVDAHGGYAHRDGEGGRIIRIAWRRVGDRDSLEAPVRCEMIYYFDGLKEIQARLLAELGPALGRLLEQQRDGGLGLWGGRILPFRQSDARGT